uniref:Uncharacterized protein n=1 Tax=Oryza nivara TaxID=4536 RepID=A0A0E0IWI4_ORYNI
MAGTPGRRPPAAGSAPQRNPTGGRVMGVFVRRWRLVLRAFAGGEDGGAALGERGDASSGISDLGLWKMDLSDDVYQLLSEAYESDDGNCCNGTFGICQYGMATLACSP